MKIALTWTDPYIKSRHGAKNCIIFKGSLKQCREKLLFLFNEYFEIHADSIRQASRITRQNFDAMEIGKNGKAFFRYDSRLFEIVSEHDANYKDYLRDF